MDWMAQALFLAATVSLNQDAPAPSQNPPWQVGSRGWVMAEEIGGTPLKPIFRFVVKCANGKIGHGPDMENRAEAIDQAFAACEN